MRDDHFGRSICKNSVSLPMFKQYMQLSNEYTFARRTTNGAGQNHIFLSCATIKKITAVGTENKRPNGGHCECLVVKFSTADEVWGKKRRIDNFLRRPLPLHASCRARPEVVGGQTREHRSCQASKHRNIANSYTTALRVDTPLTTLR